MFCVYMQITAQQAVHVLIELQQASQPKHVIASSKARQSAVESTHNVPTPELGMVSSAAKQMLQTLAEQHSCKCQPIFTYTHVQQLLQPCLKAFCQPQETAWLKGTAPAAEGRAYDAMGNAAVLTGSPAAMEGAMPPSEAHCLSLDDETVNGYTDAAGMSADSWQILRYSGAQEGTALKNSELVPHMQMSVAECMPEDHHKWM